MTVSSTADASTPPSPHNQPYPPGSLTKRAGRRARRLTPKRRGALQLVADGGARYWHEWGGGHSWSGTQLLSRLHRPTMDWLLANDLISVHRTEGWWAACVVEITDAGRQALKE